MKRSEVTADKLKALGYVAMRQFENAWRFDSKTKTVCNEKQSAELFALVVKAACEGGSVEIRKNNSDHTVNVFVEASWQEFRGTAMTYFLSRPMTAVEIVEANLYTGNWEA